MAPLSAPPSTQAAVPLDASDLEMLEMRRLRAIKKRRLRWKVSALGLPCMMILCAYFFGSGKVPFWQDFRFYIAGFMAGVALYQWSAGPVREYVGDYKDVVLPVVAGALGFHYQRKGGVPLSKVERAAIIPPYTQSNAEDLFFGDYKGAQVYVSELDLWRRQREGRRRESRKVFAGLAILVELPRVAFSGQTVVFPYAGAMTSCLHGQLAGMKHVDLVDPHFERKYRAYGTDQMESRFLLHPAMTERIERLEHPLVPAEVSVAFISGCVLVLVPMDHDLFEPPALSVPATDTENIRFLEHELRQALGIVDAFEFYRPQAP